MTGTPISGTAGQTQVSLTCTAAAGVPEHHSDGVCAALARVLTAQGYPPAVVNTDPETGSDPALNLHLHFPKGSETGLTARLGWSGPDGSEQGPVLNFGVTDTTLDARFYDRFALQILQSATPPLP